MAKSKGRVTIPTDMDVVKETLEIMNEWGADAIRDCDGTKEECSQQQSASQLCRRSRKSETGSSL